jgi:hypothetical protein
MNPYWEQWAEEAGIIYDNMKPLERKEATHNPSKLTDSKGAYMAVGGLAFTAAHYATISSIDGPLPFMDYIALATAPRAFRMGMSIGGFIHDITHD